MVHDKHFSSLDQHAALREQASGCRGTQDPPSCIVYCLSTLKRCYFFLPSRFKTSLFCLGQHAISTDSLGRTNDVTETTLLKSPAVGESLEDHQSQALTFEPEV